LKGSPASVDGVEVTNAPVADTLAAMQRGVSVIVQAALAHQGWNGRADILRRIEVPSALGAWSYEPIDTICVIVLCGTFVTFIIYPFSWTLRERWGAFSAERPRLRAHHGACAGFAAARVPREQPTRGAACPLQPKSRFPHP
jgi:hypothetical protein